MDGRLAPAADRQRRDEEWFSVTPPYATGLQILRVILEHQDFRESDCNPALIVLPELAVPYTDTYRAIPNAGLWSRDLSVKIWLGTN
jgi:hypothetical protein